MQSFILRQNVLSDNVLHVAEQGKVFKGGYIAIVEEYTFRNAWSDNKQIRRFRSEKSALSYLTKNYTHTELEHIEL